MAHYLLQPEIAGGMGENTVVNRTQIMPFVSTFHCELDGWLGDDLVESFPCFLITDTLSEALLAGNFSGFQVGDAEVTSSPKFKQMHPNRRLPRFRWLKIVGKQNSADFWIENDQSLAVSSAAYAFLKKFKLDHCQVRAEVTHGVDDD